MSDILFLIQFIIGILFIILFFKILGIANNVQHLNKIASDASKKDIITAKIETLLGNYNEAFSIYKKHFVTEVFSMFYNYDHIPTYYDRHYGELVTKYQKYLNSLGGEYTIDFEKYNSKEKIKKLLSID